MLDIGRSKRLLVLQFETKHLRHCQYLKIFPTNDREEQKNHIDKCFQHKKRKSIAVMLLLLCPYFWRFFIPLTDIMGEAIATKSALSHTDSTCNLFTANRRRQVLVSSHYKLVQLHSVLQFNIWTLFTFVQLKQNHITTTQTTHKKTKRKMLEGKSSCKIKDH